MTLIELIQLLQQPVQRVKSGLWLVPEDVIGREADYISGLPVSCDCINLLEIVIESRPAGALSAAISPEHLLEWIDIGLETKGLRSCVVFTYLDLLLTRLSNAERSAVISNLRQLPHRQRSLVVCLPQRNITHLLDENELNFWRLNRRLAEH